MSTMNPLDPYGGSTPPIEQMLGNAYDNVRKVVQNINVIKAVDANKESIDKAAQISDDVLTLKEKMKVAVSTSQAAATSATSSADIAKASELSAKNNAISANQSAQSASQSANTTTSLVGSVKKAILYYDTFAEAQAAAATLPDGQVVDVADVQKRYRVKAGALVAVIDPIIGSQLVGYDGGAVQDVLDSTKPMASYKALRAYTGRATIVRITKPDVAGFFRYDLSDTTSSDNGGTVIVGSDGRRWKRIIDGAVYGAWFGVSPSVSDNSDGIDACILAARAAGVPSIWPAGWLTYSRPIVLKSGDRLYGQGDEGTLFLKNVRTAATLASRLATGVAGKQSIAVNYSVDAALILYPDADGEYVRFVDIKGAWFSGQTGSTMVDYGIYAPDVCLSSFTNVGVKAKYGIFTQDSWMNSWRNVRSYGGTYGWWNKQRTLTGPANNLPHGGTSNTFISCWAQGCSDVGWLFEGMQYSSFVSCGADAIYTGGASRAIAYWFDGCQGISVNGMGAEDVTGTVLYAKNSTINVTGAKWLGINENASRLSAVSTPFAVIDLAGASRVTFSGANNLSYVGDATKVMPYFVGDMSKLYVGGGTELPYTGLLYGDGGVNAGAELLYLNGNATQAYVRFTVSGTVITVERSSPGLTVTRNGVGNYTITIPASRANSKMIPSVIANYTCLTESFNATQHRFRCINPSGETVDPVTVAWSCI